MFSATHFTYDGVFSGLYGLILADFDDSSVIETAAFSPTLHTTKTSASNRFFHNGITYDSHPTHTFSVICEKPIDDGKRREILRWLTGRNEFKELKIHQPDLEEYGYYCVFTDIQIIYIHGFCHGFRVTANFDSLYQRGKPSVIDPPERTHPSLLYTDGLIEMSGTETFTINNRSDIVDDYVFPKIDFYVYNPVFTIINRTDDPSGSRPFQVSNIASSQYGDGIVVDNELRTFRSLTGKITIEQFNKNWLRLLPGVNTLEITTNGSVYISCPHYVMLGF